MLIITASLRFDPKDREEVLAGLREITELSRRDPGCVDYWWAEALDEPAHFRIFECWESEELLQAHLSQPHEAEFMARYLSRVIGTEAYSYDAANRRSPTG